MKGFTEFTVFLDPVTFFPDLVPDLALTKNTSVFNSFKQIIVISVYMYLRKFSAGLVSNYRTSCVPYYSLILSI